MAAAAGRKADVRLPWQRVAAVTHWWVFGSVPGGCCGDQAAMCRSTRRAISSPRHRQFALSSASDVWVTCYTDASFRPKYGAGWAVWLRSDAGRIVRSGPCPSYVSNASHAEMAAIFAGVYLAIRIWGSRVRGIQIRSDSLEALGWADPESAISKQAPAARLQQRLREVLREHGVTVERRWVKGHRGCVDVAAYLNTQCDKLSKKARKAQEPCAKVLPKKQKRRLKRHRRRACKASERSDSPCAPLVSGTEPRRK